MEDDWLTDDEELDGPAYKTRLKVVTHSHFIDKRLRDKCTNPECNTSFVFPSVRRRHHCRRCGEVFCRTCLQYRRRLNVMAQPNAKGILSTVCLKCYVERQIILEGVRRSSTMEFLDMRSVYLEERRQLIRDVTIEVKQAVKFPTFWKEQFEIDIPKECQRLLNGFKSEASSSDTLKTMKEVKESFTIPYWQKSTYWQLEKSATTCRVCIKNVSGMNKKRHCKVCGLALCKKCAKRELLLYFEDGCIDRENIGPRIAIIRLEGCPEKEPRYSVLLCLCTDCRSYISEKQISDVDWFVKKPKPPDVTSQFQAIDAIFRDLEADIDKTVSQFEETTKTCNKENAKINRRASTYGLVQSFRAMDTKRDLDANKQTLTEKLNQKMCRYYSLFAKVKNLQKEHRDSIGRGFGELLTNYIKCRNQYYIRTKCRITGITKTTDQPPTPSAV